MKKNGLQKTFILLTFLIFETQLFAQTPDAVQQGGTTYGWSGFTNNESTGLGSVSIVQDFSGVTNIRHAPAVGVHPRIYFNPSDTAELFNRLRTTTFGQKIMKCIKAYTILLNKGLSGGFNNNASYARDEFNIPFISNTGYSDVSVAYKKLIAEDPSVWTGLDLRKTIAALSLEAFECYMFQGQTNPDVGISYNTRAANLAKATTYWAKYVLANPTLFTPNTNEDYGGMHLGHCYDLNFWAMTPTQRDSMRKAIAQFVPTLPRYGYQVNCTATTSNWAALNGFEVLTNLSIEGETGYNAVMTREWARVMWNFMTYGYHTSGEGYEGTGKNYMFITTLVALAKRGYSALGHPNLRAYVNDYLPALVQPYEQGFIGTDLWGGSGRDPVLGGYRINASDPLGGKYVFPNEAGADFVWKAYVNTAEHNQNSATNYVVQNFAFNDTYYSSLFLAPIFGLNHNSTLAQGALNNQLDYFSKVGGLGVMRSDFSTNGMLVQFHARQNNGGHTYGNRNEFTLSALGRTWLPRLYSGSTVEATYFHNCILIDGKGVPITNLEGYKARQPAKVIGWQSANGVSSVTGDATYSYNWEWSWQPQSASANNTNLGSTWSQVTETPNDFQQTPLSTNLYPYANASYYNQPYWNAASKFDRMVKKRYQTVEKVKRTVSLIRTSRPFLLITDDVKMDAQAHTYRWQTNVSADLTVESTDINLLDNNYRCDIVLKEASGNRRLLVRVLNNTGYTGSTPPAFLEDVTFVDFWGNTFAINPSGTRKRLVIESNSVEPKFRVLIFPFYSGQTLPKTDWDMAHNTLRVTLDSETKTFLFGENTQAGQTSLVQLTTTTIPVELHSFEATAIEKSNLLTWKTANEINNLGFDIERSHDSNIWENVGFEKNKGSQATYTFSDTAPLSISYYRLRQKDMNGKNTLSKIVTVNRTEQAKTSLYPNAANDRLHIQTTEKVYSILIFNNLGQLLITQKQATEIDITRLPSGTYWLLVETPQYKTSPMLRFTKL